MLAGQSIGVVAEEVIVNGTALRERQLLEIQRAYGVRPSAGAYWYDSRSGLYGLAGGPAAGFMMTGHELGELRADASRGDTGIFINGREIPAVEKAFLARLLSIQPVAGRYWLDGYGNIGVEGSPVPLVNLYLAAQAAGGAAGSNGGDNFWSTHFSAGNYDQGNQRGYVSVPGIGPVGYGF